MNNDKTLLGIGQSLYRAENTAAIVGSVTGVDIYVQRTEAEGAVVARRIAERQYLLAAVFANKALVVLFKSLFFHTPSP